MKLEIVDTEDKRQQGLSGRGLITGGMLFVFDDVSQDHCMWMEDMNFAIDIIWLDESKTVVDLKQSITPATYPASFCPSQKALYVIELGAGEAAINRVAVGDTLKF